MMKTKLKDNSPNIIWGTCLDCDFQGQIDEFDYDYDYDEFWGNEIKYPICPKCGGGVELSKVNDIDNN